MPVPTDTFWNIKRLNVAFAVCALALTGVIGWAVLQDYNKTWRIPQRNGAVWDAALTQEKIVRKVSPQEQAKYADTKATAEEIVRQVKTAPTVDYAGLVKRIDALTTQYPELKVEATPDAPASVTMSLARVRELLTAGRQNVEDARLLTADIAAKDSQSATLTFANNNDKASLQVLELQLQDAKTSAAGQRTQEVETKEKSIQGLRDKVFKATEEISRISTDIREARKARDLKIKPVNELDAGVKKWGADFELLKKKLGALDPKKAEYPHLAVLSQQIRGTPLLQFMNPAERVDQVVLPDIRTDVSFTQIDTIDRCTTCHVHIDNKDFTEAKVLAFLEEQLATARAMKFPAPKKAEDPTAERPGASALPEFWQAWASKTGATSVLVKNAKLLTPVTSLVGKKGLSVKVDGAVLASFEYKPAGGGHAKQDAILTQLLAALGQWEPGAAVTLEDTAAKVAVEIEPAGDGAPGDGARLAALNYSAEMRKAVTAKLDTEGQHILGEQYRAALCERVNEYRRGLGLTPLDASIVQLAHPRLDLYADADSAHPRSTVGCTSCHDGSGQETDFVLAAHWPRAMWVDSTTGLPIHDSQIDRAQLKGEGEGLTLSSMLETVNENGVDKLHFGEGHAEATPATRPAVAQLPPLPEPAFDDTTLTYVDPVTGKAGKAVSQAHYWAHKYEAESGTTFEAVEELWDRPMRTPEFLQANCARCHADINDIRDEAPVLYEGRALFSKMGCANCHQMDSIPAAQQKRVGPDLRHVADKLSPAFMQSWIWAPKAFRPSTLMPHLFMLENSSSDEELKRTQQEVLAMSTYLRKTSTPALVSSTIRENPMPPANDDPAQVTERVARGREIFLGNVTDKQGGVGCIACHSNLNETGEKWITGDLEKGGVLAEELRAKAGKEPAAADLKKEAKKRYDAMSYNERQLYAHERFGALSISSAIPKYADGSPKPVFMHHGPELSGEGTKLLAGGADKAQARQWLYNWLIDPRHYSEYTVMPRLRLGPQEALDLAEYLLAQERKNRSKNDDWEAVEIKPDGAKLTEIVGLFLRGKYSEQTSAQMAVNESELTDRAAEALTNKFTTRQQARDMAAKLPLQEKQMLFAGQKLISHYGCMSCHAINGMENVSSPCTNLSDWGQKAVTKLDYGYLDHHKANVRPAQSPVPMVNGLSTKSVALLSKLNERKSGAAPAKDAEEKPKPGERGEAHAGGAEGTTLSQVAELSWPHVEHTREAWLVQKIRNSRIYDRGQNIKEPVPAKRYLGKPYDKLRMPTFYMKDSEVHAIATFVISNRDRLISPTLAAKTTTDEAQRIAHGRYIAEKYNCVGCHQTELNQPPIQQYWLSGLFPKDDMVLRAPPILRGETARVQAAWLFNFLKNVEKIRPLPYVRMPSFPITDEDTTALAAYFNASGKRESRHVRRHVDNLIKDASKGREEQLASDPESIWPADDWFKLDKYQAAADFLRNWSLDNGYQKPLAFSPSQSVEDLAKTYKTALYDARFVATLSDAPYPFSDAPRGIVSDERFKRGEELFHYMNCQQCHVVVGTTPAPAAGINLQPKGPNLTLAVRRLQRRFVRQWVQDPPLVQPGSAMPPFFSGRGITKPDVGVDPTSPATTALSAEPDAGVTLWNLHGTQYVPSGAAPEEIRRIQAAFGKTTQEQTDLLLDFVFASGVRAHTSLDATPKLADAPAGFRPEPVSGSKIDLTKPVEVKVPAAKPTADATTPGAPLVMSSVTGKISFDGAYEAKMIDVSGTQQCAAKHAGGKIADDRLVVAADKGLRDAVVSVVNPPSGKFDVPEGVKATFDQVGCRYEPHVLATMVGQKVTFLNADAFAHNVHGLPNANAMFNFAQNNVDRNGMSIEMKAAEQFGVKCDVHPWMNAKIYVFEHPFFSVTRADGTFTIPNLPTGDYTLRIEQEACEPLEVNVKVEAGKPAQITAALKRSAQ